MYHVLTDKWFSCLSDMIFFLAHSIFFIFFVAFMHDMRYILLKWSRLHQINQVNASDLMFTIYKQLQNSNSPWNAKILTLCWFWVDLITEFELFLSTMMLWHPKAVFQFHWKKIERNKEARKSLQNLRFETANQFIKLLFLLWYQMISHRCSNHKCSMFIVTIGTMWNVSSIRTRMNLFAQEKLIQKIRSRRFEI